MSRALNSALERARRLPLDVERDRYVIVSDQHLGDGKENDDFRGNRKLYKQALKWYQDQGFTLIILGDGEELWECDFPEVRELYKDIFDVYHDFAAEHRLIRVYGNHDIFWRSSSYVRSFLPDRNPPPVIDEALLLESGGGKIFLTHGHQGEFFSDKLWQVSRFFVRVIWRRAQQLFGCRTGAAKNVKKRNAREREYYHWAKEPRLLFIAGHTHRAMFGSRSKLDRLRSDIDELLVKAGAMPSGSPELSAAQAAIDFKKAALLACLEHEFHGIAEQQLDEGGPAIPCYFNDGCCSYDNGMTAMEVAQGEMRLVKWDRTSGQRTVYEYDSLNLLFTRITQS